MTIKLEIDGKPVEVANGATVMEAANKLGTFVPHFCYHRKLSIAANCRMCLVQVEKAPKPVPACATPATEGMKVYTQSAQAVQAQKGVMEFLLINHPLDCPICDQGGECQLQDLAVGYGGSCSRYEEDKRVVVNKNLGPLIATDMTRCIHCTRCVRFGQEIAGVMELGMAGRGEHAEILSFVGRTVDSELSGNMIDLCPVGALTSKPFRYSARTWELARRRSVSPHDGLGSNLVMQVKQDRVMRVVPHENEAINECWLSDRDRFAYEGLNTEDRLARPMVCKDGAWVEVDWPEALESVATGLKAAVAKHGPAALGALVSPTLTLEELHLATKLARGLGTGNIDHHFRALDSRARFAGAPWLGMKLSELGTRQAVLLVGSTIRKEHPLVASRLRQGAKKGLAVSVVHVAGDDLLMPVAHRLVARPSGLAAALASVAKAAAEIAGKPLQGEVARAAAGVAVPDEARAIAKDLAGRERAAILLGNYAQQHADYAVLAAIAHEIARLTGATLGVLAQNANSVGAKLVGAHPLEGGLDTRAMVTDPRKAWLVAGFEPERDAAMGPQAIAALKAAEFVVAFSAWRCWAPEYAHVILPIAPSAETAGTFVNMEGRVQSFHAVVKPRGDARPGWKVLRMLGTMLGLPGFEAETLEAVRASIAPDLDAWARAGLSNELAPFAFTLGEASTDLERVAEWPVYGTDAQVRRAPSLQKTADARAAARARMNAATAIAAGLAPGDRVRVTQGGGEAVLEVAVDPALPDGCVRVARGIAETVSLGEGALALRKVVAEAAA
ncbi:MAG: NADH-quinone oxidoreductase subunit NuoG [Betaproteobacteria bacterium]|nr:NADH-quinone oxidoreductase subunit NuoG [Betaproteobacteria bacterium]